MEIPAPSPVRADCAYPVHELSTPAVGVPMAGVTRLGDVAHTMAPVPVPPSVTAERRLAEEGAPNHVEMPEPSPVRADCAYPVHELRTPEVGVPSAGVVRLGEMIECPVMVISPAIVPPPRGRYTPEPVGSQAAPVQFF